MPQSQYELTLNISSADLDTIQAANESIAIAKAGPAARPTAIWATLMPVETNHFEWTEEYRLYASLPGQGEITAMRLTPFQPEPGLCYPLTADGAFGDPVSCPVPIAPADFGVVNGYEPAPSLTFGLAMHGTPVSAEVIPFNQQGTFSPMPDVWVWLQSPPERGPALEPGQAISKPAVVSYETGPAMRTLVYDASQAMFIPAG